MINFLFTIGGLVISGFGSFFLAISFGKFRKEFGGSTTGTDGKTYSIAYLNRPSLFKIGLWFLLAGFVFQFLGLIIAGRETVNRNSLELKEKCRQAGEKIYQQHLKDFSNQLGSSVFNPEYGYSKTLNTCLYAGGAISSPSGEAVIQRWVIDSYTNREILSFSKLAETRLGNVSSTEEFDARKTQLFNE